MSWQVFVRASAESDLGNLSEAEQRALTAEMFAWVEAGPPRQTLRDVLGVEMFDDVPAGFRITYVASTTRTSGSSLYEFESCGRATEATSPKYR